jgi:hypothetical protein
MLSFLSLCMRFDSVQFNFVLEYCYSTVLYSTDNYSEVGKLYG